VDGLDDQVIEAAQPFEGTLPAPRTPVRGVSFAAGDLAGLRHLISEWTAGESLPREAGEELVLAVNELATNSIRYGDGGGRLLLWREQDTLMCEVQDAGHIQDPLVGRSRPAPDEHTGRGLWLVNELCDLVQIRSSPKGTSVRVHKRLLPPEG
jgi:anti-sigma regulatory factor (Ser/Thr protein kinase)